MNLEELTARPDTAKFAASEAGALPGTAEPSPLT
jgi:hypothetical protein